MTGTSGGADAAVTLHATCVALPHGAEACGLLISGVSGSGKSALALELLALGAQLVADDQTRIERVEGGLRASAPAGLPAMIEARGIGLLPTPLQRSCMLVAAVDLDQTETERLPPPRYTELLGQRLPQFRRVDSRAFPAALLHYLRHAQGIGQMA